MDKLQKIIKELLSVKVDDKPLFGISVLENNDTVYLTGIHANRGIAINMPTENKEGDEEE